MGNAWLYYPLNRLSEHQGSATFGPACTRAGTLGFRFPETRMFGNSGLSYLSQESADTLSSNPHGGNFASTRFIAGHLALPIIASDWLDFRFGWGSVLEYHREGNPIWTFGHGWDEAYARLHFNDSGWAPALQAGYFRLRANPDAALLGEYLFRYGAYPSHLLRRGHAWDSLGAQTAKVLGARVSLDSPGKRWRHDWVLLSDRVAAVGTRDFSLGYAASVAILPGVEAGGGVEWLYPDFHSRPAAPSESTYVLTRAGEIVMGRLALDPKTWLGWRTSRESDGRLFAEAGVLGWKNQDKVYATRSDRFVFMMGANLPAFGILDKLCLQAERYPLPAPVVWNVPQQAERASPSSWTWSVYLSRQVLSWLVLQGVYLDLPEERIAYRPSFAEPSYGRQRTFTFRVEARVY